METNHRRGGTDMLPEIGQELFLQIDEGNDASTNYKSKVIDMTDEYISIFLPTQQNSGHTRVFRPGTRIEISHFGKDGSKYVFPSVILENINDRIPFVRVSVPAKEEIIRKQRRNFLRVPAYADVALKLVEPRDREIHFVTKTEDVSGGGIAIKYPATYDIRIDDQFEVWMALPCSKDVLQANFIAKVVRIIDQKKPGKKLAPLEIINISQKDQQNIMKYCFECEIDLRKKGLI